jgi:hypothetical protein
MGTPSGRIGTGFPTVSMSNCVWTIFSVGEPPSSTVRPIGKKWRIAEFNVRVANRTVVTRTREAEGWPPHFSLPVRISASATGGKITNRPDKISRFPPSIKLALCRIATSRRR